MNNNIKTILVIVGIAIFIIFTNSDGGFERDENGSIISGGNITSDTLRVGDCFNDLDPEAMKRLLEEDNEESEIEINYVEALPCSMPHTNEVYADSVTLFDGFDSYPSEDDLIDRVRSLCLPEGFKYLGIDESLRGEEKFLVARAAFPDFYVYLFPLKSSWDRGSRKISCVIYTELPREGSARNLLIKD